MVAVSLEIGEAAEHSQWFPGGAYRLGMAEIYTNLLGGSNESTRPSQLIGALRAAEGWGPAWSAQSAWCDWVSAGPRFGRFFYLLWSHFRSDFVVAQVHWHGWTYRLGAWS